MVKKRNTWKSCTLPWAKKKAWSEFSKYVRINHADERGMCTCISCGVEKHWKDIQAGHFVEGRGNAVLFDEDIVFPQCYACNIMKGGNYYEYLKAMKRRTGMSADDLLEWRDELKRKIVKFTISDLKEIHDKYKKLSEKKVLTFKS